MVPYKFDSEFERSVVLTSIITTYVNATRYKMEDLRQGAADTFCRLFEVISLEELHALRVTRYGDGDDH